MTEADGRDDIIFDLHLAEPGDRNAVLVRLVREHPELREELVDHFCEIVWMEWRAASEPEPPCPPVDEAEAARSLARFRAIEAGLGTANGG